MSNTPPIRPACSNCQRIPESRLSNGEYKEAQRDVNGEWLCAFCERSGKVPPANDTEWRREIDKHFEIPRPRAVREGDRIVVARDSRER